MAGLLLGRRRNAEPEEIAAADRDQARVFTGATEGPSREPGRTFSTVRRADGRNSFSADHRAFLVEDLEDASRTGALAESDLEALQAVARRIKTFVVKPYKDLGRTGALCPLLPGSLERKSAGFDFWLLAHLRTAARGCAVACDTKS